MRHVIACARVHRASARTKPERRHGTGRTVAHRTLPPSRVARSSPLRPPPAKQPHAAATGTRLRAERCAGVLAFDEGHKKADERRPCTKQNGWRGQADRRGQKLYRAMAQGIAGGHLALANATMKRRMASARSWEPGAQGQNTDLRLRRTYVSAAHIGCGASPKPPKSRACPNRASWRGR